MIIRMVRVNRKKSLVQNEFETEECCVVVQSGYQKSEKKMEDERGKTASGIKVENSGKADQVVKSSVKDVREHSVSLPRRGG
ncbi:unnamed protein product [Thelazia callipaeda]|uniref:Ovule protein n=1 Tax=Thelazia callipaeda TaxID=103827 RepID=A0A0N5CTC8_THECL|nr:unnamed protein product [Thelazia callipaeda]